MATFVVKDKIKIENNTDKVFSFRPYRQNFIWKINPGDILELKTNSAGASLQYYKSVLPYAEVSMIDEFDPGPTPGGGLTPFADGQTISGIVVDPNGRPTGYEDTTLYPTVVDAMNAWFATLGLSDGQDADLINKNDYITAMNTDDKYSLTILNRMLQPQTSEMELFEFVFLGDEMEGMAAGWWAIYTNNNEEMDVQPLTAQTTMTLAQTLSDVSPESGLSAINGTVVGAVVGGGATNP